MEENCVAGRSSKVPKGLNGEVFCDAVVCASVRQCVVEVFTGRFVTTTVCEKDKINYLAFDVIYYFL